MKYLKIRYRADFQGFLFCILEDIKEKSRKWLADFCHFSEKYPLELELFKL